MKETYPSLESATALVVLCRKVSEAYIAFAERLRGEGRDHFGNIAATIAVCGYMLSFWIPLSPDVSLLWLALWGFVALSLVGTSKEGAFQPKLVAPLLFFLAFTAVSLWLSKLPSLGIVGNLAFVPGTVLYLLIAYRFKERWNLEALFAALAILAAILGGAIFITSIRHPTLDPSGLIAAASISIFAVPNDVIFLAILAPFCVAMLRRNSSAPQVGIALLALVAIGISLAIMRSRGAIVTLAVGLTIMAICMRGRTPILAIGGVLLSTVVADLVLGLQLATKFAGGFEEHRFATWWSAWTMFRQAPIWGNGPNTYGSMYVNLLANHSIPETFATDQRFIPWPHNLYLELLAERGLLGFAAFAFVAAQMIATYANATQTASEPEKVYVHAALAAVVSFGVAAVFELTFLRVWVVLMWCILLGITESIRRLAVKKNL